MVINEKLIGMEFEHNTKTNVRCTCQGFAFTGTIIVFGSTWDQANNRTKIETFKLSEISFIGTIN